MAKLNGIEKPWIILPDQVLKLPPKKPVKPGAKLGNAPASHSGTPAATHPTAHSAAAPAPALPLAATGTQAGHSGAAGVPTTHSVATDAPGADSTAAPGGSKATQSTSETSAKAAPVVPTAAKPVVTEKRSAETQHPEAEVVKAVIPDRIAAAIAFAMAHKKPKSIHYCLRYVKNALVAAGLFEKYPGGEHAKNFGSFLAKEGFRNLLQTAPGTNLDTAPIGAVIVYSPMEKQKFEGREISGHIEIKCAHGYVSDFLAHTATYGTDTKTLKSTHPNKYKVTFQVIGIWYKE